MCRCPPLLPAPQGRGSPIPVLGGCWGLAGSGTVCHWVSTVLAPWGDVQD